VRTPPEGNDGEPIGFKGLASVFNKRAKIGGGMWGWLEEIAPGTFAETIEADDIRMLKNHNTDLPLARNTTGALRLSESKRGLETDADMDPTTYAFDLAVNLERGTVSQMSFGFEVKADEWITLDDDDPDKGKVVEPELRIIKRVKLWEVSPVTFPAYVDTDAALRVRDFDTIARSLGLDDEQLHALAVEARNAGNAQDVVAALATRLGQPTAPAIAPSSDTPAERTRRAIAASLFPTRISRVA
jgi:HK97 family phage prohead protease